MTPIPEEGTIIGRLNGLARRWEGLLIIGVPLISIVGSVVAMLLVVRTDLGYTQTVPAARIERVELKVDSLQEFVAGTVDSLTEVMIGQNRIIRALGADWCLRVSDDMRAASEVNCYELTRGIRR